MQPADLRRILETIRRFLADSNIGKVTFVWHGGEPFLLPPSYYEEANRLQEEIFNGVALQNRVQTNLTVLTEQHMALIEGGFFSDLGISFDVYGDQRVDTAGRSRTATVLHNMQLLIDRGISFGAIAVLARTTLPHLQNIYCFFDDLRIPLRALAFYKQADEDQARAHALTYGELLQAYQCLFNLWAASANATPVDPIESFIDGACRILSGAPVPRYTVEDETVLLVAPDGSVWGEADCYDASYCYGNVRDSSVKDILASSGRMRAMSDAQERVERICTSCPYWHFCSGEFVATATQSQRRLMEEGCVRREMLSYIVERFGREQLAQSVNASPVATGSGRLSGLGHNEVSLT
jgi:uncharacterized protein